MTNPEAPQSLREDGLAFWNDVRANYELREDELVLLRAAARLIDELAVLEAALDEQGVTVVGSRGQPRTNPLLRDARDHRIALQRILGTVGGIGLSSAEEDPADSALARSSAGRRMAHVRWHGAAGG